jgi:hypothetical protein
MASRFTNEKICYSVAGVGALAPLYMLVPSASERVAMQTARWAPRWERNVGYLTIPAQRAAVRTEPPVARTVRRIEHRLPLERVARATERGLRRQFDKWWS